MNSYEPFVLTKGNENRSVAPAFMAGFMWGMNPHATEWLAKGVFSSEGLYTNDDENTLPFKGREGVGMGLSKERLLIIGLGNPLMGDDGAGIQVVNELMAADLPEYVDVIDGGTPGVGLIDLMSGYSRVIVVDAVMVEGGSSQREVYLTTFQSTLSLRERERSRVGFTSDDNCSLHETELTSVLRLMQTLEMTIPEITIVGIPAVRIAPGIGLSEECQGVIPQAVNLIKEVVAQVDYTDLQLPQSGGRIP